MAENGKLPASTLADIPGGRLRQDAAASWQRLRNRIGKETGQWICPTSTRTAYRTFAEQQYFWNLYQSGKGNLAARPGTSNHGWGITVDVPTTKQRQLIDKYGADYGWSKKWSDAPSEWWHIKYDPNRDKHRGEPAKPKKHPRNYLTGAEKAARDTLVKERRVAKRHGGWAKVDAGHLQRASKAKGRLRTQLTQIRKAAAKDGWNKVNRKQRADYIKTLLEG